MWILNDELYKSSVSGSSPGLYPIFLSILLSCTYSLSCLVHYSSVQGIICPMETERTNKKYFDLEKPTPSLKKTELSINVVQEHNESVRAQSVVSGLGA